MTTRKPEPSIRWENRLAENMDAPPDSTSPGPRIVDVYETVLYGSDIDAVALFYRDIVGLTLIKADPDLMAALRLPGGGVLLIFDPLAAAVPGRPVPSHGTDGAGHVAFRVDDLDSWRAHLTDRGLEIEREIDWHAESSSVYVRDPAGNSVEFVHGDLW